MRVSRQGANKSKCERITIWSLKSRTCEAIEIQTWCFEGVDAERRKGKSGRGPHRLWKSPLDAILDKLRHGRPIDGDLVIVEAWRVDRRIHRRVCEIPIVIMINPRPSQKLYDVRVVPNSIMAHSKRPGGPFVIPGIPFRKIDLDDRGYGLERHPDEMRQSVTMSPNHHSGACGDLNLFLLGYFFRMDNVQFPILPLAQIRKRLHKKLRAALAVSLGAP